ncbi:MAG: T9SS type A sorting domain-containing protein [Hymenobacter sp.]|nr:MAG: T9SS type A sorting domain-containing protein [Hymenobacter sp.]
MAVPSSAPYTYTWMNAPAGAHTLSAVATDNGGATGTSTNVSITVVSGICTGTGPGNEYGYEVSTTGGVVSWKFIPLGATVGSTLAILYTRTGTGGYAGYTMTAQGGNFIYSQTWPANTPLQFYFTYRVGNSGLEHNSSAAPHAYTTGTQCATLATRATIAAALLLYPNPVQHTLTVELPAPATGPLLVRSVLGTEVLRQAATGATVRLDVAALPKGVYLLTVPLADGPVTRKFVKE